MEQGFGARDQQGSGLGARIQGHHGASLGAFDSIASRYLTELANHGRSPHTRRQYAYNLRYWASWLQGYQIDPMSVSRQDAEQYLTDLRLSKLMPATISARFQVVRCIYKWMVGVDIIARDPFAAVLGIKIPRKVQAVMNLSEVERMAKACRTPKERAIIETLYSTGMRRAGLCGIKLDDLDLEAGTVKITKKGGDEQFCLLTPKAVKAIQVWIKVRSRLPVLRRKPTGQLFIGRSGSMCPVSVGHLVKRIRMRAGFNKRITCHAFRRSMATHLSDNGARIEEIQQILGHESIQTTQKYVMLSTARIRDAWQKLPRR